MSDNEPSKSGGFWDRVKATKFAIESIAFEHQALKKKDSKDWIGLLGVFVLWLVSVIFMYESIQRKSPLLVQAEAQTFSGVMHYMAAFSDQNIWTIFKPDFNSLKYCPPLYYILYVPILKFVTPDLNMAMLIVNSLFLLVIAIMPFYAVREARGWVGGLLASTALMACPFVAQAARTPSSSIAVIALVTGMYCAYMCYQELVDNRWSYAIAAFLVLGMYTSGTFWIFVLPLFHSLSIGMMNYVNSSKFLNIILPGILISVAWYVFMISMIFLGIMPFRGEYHGIWGLLKDALPSLGLPVLVIGGLSMLWLYFNRFQPYEKRKEIIFLFLMPWALFTFLVCPNDSSSLYPAFVAFPLAIGIMMPFRMEKIFVGVFAVLLIANSLASPVRIAGLTLFGIQNEISAVGIPHDVLLSSIRENLPQGSSKIAVYSTDGSLNAESLSFAYNRNKNNAQFINAPFLPMYSDMVLNHKSSDGSNSKSFNKLRNDEAFSALFAKKEELKCSDGSSIEIYSKNARFFDILQPGKRYPIGTITIGGFTAKNVTLKVEDYNESTRSYNGVMSAAAATLYSGDIYGLKVDVSGIVFSSIEGMPVVSDISGARISGARLSSYGIEGMIGNQFPYLKSPSVHMSNNRLHVTGTLAGRSIAVSLALKVPKPGIIEIRPVSVTFMGINIPESIRFILSIFNYRINIAENAYGLSLSSINMNNEIMEIK